MLKRNYTFNNLQQQHRQNRQKRKPFYNNRKERKEESNLTSKKKFHVNINAKSTHTACTFLTAHTHTLTYIGSFNAIGSTEHNQISVKRDEQIAMRRKFANKEIIHQTRRQNYSETHSISLHIRCCFVPYTQTHMYMIFMAKNSSQRQHRLNCMIAFFVFQKRAEISG